MNKTNLANSILEAYHRGQRYFEGLDMENESLEEQNLEGVVFNKCSLYISFRKANLSNAHFINGGIKTCDFREANLTNAHFENVCIESAQFARAITTGIYFDNNSCYGQDVTQQHFEEWIKDHEE
ncbi:pentapeptide repeat-containing protein [Hymenobacter sp. BT186]|uniref:Pentapeptide repeat-containing protein n=1 Tax=Hymenobacter telluris TaxID=2816474 RepID=A0A939EV34_9BACT|nr:pentapeptide repeat-containing protein [Hymenobacter telluris]MBO0358065.1 pentapeptide repeat-containing protein [Hymenobacter telluris]MBW3374092.1 pentapeptide repeat-containing protein [Hymenobacter norwichensis]